jgi:hypothetical protein
MILVIMYDKTFITNDNVVIRNVIIHLGDKSISCFVYTASHHHIRMYFSCV